MAHRRLKGATYMDQAIVSGLTIGTTPVTPTSTGAALAVHNATGGTLTQGTLVYISGWDTTSAKFKVVKADADGGAGVDRAGLIITADILNAADGFAQQALELTGLNTNAGNVGDPVYLSTTAGGWTLTAPTAAGSVAQVIGRISVKSATVGKVQFILYGNPFPIMGSNEFQAGSVVETVLDPSVSLGLGALRTCHSVYDFATDAGATGTLALRGGTIPDKAIVYGGILNVNTALNSGGSATAALQFNAANDLVTATAFGSAPWSTTGIKAVVPVMTAATAIKGTAARVPSLVIGTANLTGGHFNLTLLYFVTDAAN